MKKLNRLNIDALKKANPILGSIEQRLIIGGVGPGDCVFRCIGHLVGTDQDAVRNTYARYLMVNSGIVPGACGGDGNECGNNIGYWQEYADLHGVANNHLNWIMSEYNFTQTSTPAANNIMICQYINGENGSTDYHAVVITAANDYWIRYEDLQSGGDGYLFINDNGTYTNSGGDKQIKIHSMYKYRHK